MKENELALFGGTPVRKTLLRYATQLLDEEDRKAVEDVLCGDWLTTGPSVAKFEEALCEATGAKYAVAVNTGTAALHAACQACGIGCGDEVIVPAISFVASSNCVLYQRAVPVFADLSADTLNIDPEAVERAITPRTKAVVAVEFAGHPCDHEALRDIAGRHGLTVISDAAHALGATYHGKDAGALEDMSTFSFHPVKHITTGEGGALLTDRVEWARKARSFRHHGIDLDLHARGSVNQWTYDVVTLGYNYRIPDINCALGTSQIKKSSSWLARRRQIVAAYHKALSDCPMVQLPVERPGVESAWHLYVVRVRAETLKDKTRGDVFKALRAENIGVNVHYIPIPWMTLYQKLGYRRGSWPVAEAEYERVISLPMYPGMSDDDVADVVNALSKIWNAWKR